MLEEVEELGFLAEPSSDGQLVVLKQQQGELPPWALPVIAAGVIVTIVVGGLIYFVMAAPPSTKPAGAISVSINATPGSGIAPLSVNFAANVAGGVSPYSYAWNFGDGSPTSSSANSTHVFENPGTYNVSLTVVDAQGKTGTAQVTVTVSAPAVGGTVGNMVQTQGYGEQPILDSVPAGDHTMNIGTTSPPGYVGVFTSGAATGGIPQIVGVVAPS